ncbi:MAG: TRAP transporter small permease [Bacteroidia bacterium]|nr:TRAP transporter small permease [Bacteroidia bacterium]
MDTSSKHTLLGIGTKLSYILGTVIPNISFTIIFLTFMLTIVSRYILRTPISWSYEISILAYMWTMFFGVGKAMKRGEHVVFSLVYDKVSPKMQRLFLILTDTLLILLLGLAFIPSIHSLLGKRMITGVLKMPYTIVFAPCIYMFAEIIIRSCYDLYIQAKALIHESKGAQL